MAWTEFIGNRKPIDALFAVAPRLKGVRVSQIALDQDGPSVSLRIDLNEFPEKPPMKWAVGGFNRVQLTLVLGAVKRLFVRGWGTNNFVDIDFQGHSSEILVKILGAGTEAEIECLFAEVGGISGYHESETN